MILFRKTTHSKEFFIYDNDMMVRQTDFSMDFRDNKENTKVQWFKVNIDNPNELKRVNKQLNDHFENEYQQKLHTINDEN